MTKTIELIKKHSQEIEEYMDRNGEWSFHKFSDGAIHYIDSLFNIEPITVYGDALPLQPVSELEELKKAVEASDALITINDFVKFDGSKVILGDTEIRFYGVGVTVEYTGIRSLDIDYNYDLKAILKTTVKGYFGRVVYIDGHLVDIKYLYIMEKGVSFPVIKRGEYITAYFSYESIDSIRDEEGGYIYRRSKK